MEKKSHISAGILMYRRRDGKSEVLLVHPGGPFYKNKEFACWDIPKGEINEGEELFEAAKREFAEETSFPIPLGNFIALPPVKRTKGFVHIWAFEGDADVTKIKSNTCMIEWPPKSGKQMEIPEIDRGAFFSIEEARKRVYPYLVSVIEEFEKIIVKS
jgi:predicted NUDIX family NTP pyrophosphohydrolase